MDPYKILDLPKSFTLTQLKENYKRIALQVHPDKGGSEQLFQLVTKSYKYLLDEYNKRNSEKEFYDLKNDFKKSLKVHEGRSSGAVSDSKGFDINKFNKIFNDNKLETVEDKGYQQWMQHSDVPQQKQLSSFNEKQFHREFEKQKPVDKQNKYIVKYKEPEPLTAAKKISFTELGVDDVDDFSGENMSKKNLNYMDYKVAHTTTRIVDPSLVKNVKQYKNVDELEKERSRVRYQMNEEEMEEYILQKRLEKLREQKRVETLRKQESMQSDHYERVNQLLLALRR